MNTETITRVETHSNDILNTREAAVYLRLSVSTLTRARRRRILRAEMLTKWYETRSSEEPPPQRSDQTKFLGPKFVRFGTKVFYRREELDKWKEEPD